MATVSRTLAEIDAVARKAARGSGHAWGTAEEAGRAVRWLEARGLPGCAALANLLSMQTTAPPVFDGAVWRSETGDALCPLLLGAALSDRRALGIGDRAEHVAWPLLLTPFLERLWPWWANNPSLIDVITFADPSEDLPPSRPAAPHIDAAVWSQLEGFAHATYVPATAESRLSGAGAGLTDND